jgi:hypothetical protein
LFDLDPRNGSRRIEEYLSVSKGRWKTGRAQHEKISDCGTACSELLAKTGALYRKTGWQKARSIANSPPKLL